GERGGGVEARECGLRTARETRAWLRIEGEILADLAEAWLAAGEVERAQGLAEDAIACCRRRKTPVWEAEAHLALARVRLARASPDPRRHAEAAPADAPRHLAR